MIAFQRGKKRTESEDDIRHFEYQDDLLAFQLL